MRALVAIADWFETASCRVGWHLPMVSLIDGRKYCANCAKRI